MSFIFQVRLWLWRALHWHTRGATRLHIALHDLAITSGREALDIGEEDIEPLVAKALPKTRSSTLRKWFRQLNARCERDRSARSGEFLSAAGRTRATADRGRLRLTVLWRR